MVMEDLTLGDEHRMQYTDDVSLNCTLETYIIVLISVTTVNLIKKTSSVLSICNTLRFLTLQEDYIYDTEHLIYLIRLMQCS